MMEGLQFAEFHHPNPLSCHEEKFVKPKDLMNFVMIVCVSFSVMWKGLQLHV